MLTVDVEIMAMVRLSESEEFANKGESPTYHNLV